MNRDGLGLPGSHQADVNRFLRIRHIDQFDPVVTAGDIENVPADSDAGGKFDRVVMRQSPRLLWVRNVHDMQPVLS